MYGQRNSILTIRKNLLKENNNWACPHALVFLELHFVLINLNVQYGIMGSLSTSLSSYKAYHIKWY